MALLNAVVVLMLLGLISLPFLLRHVQHDAVSAAKVKKSMTAYNFAEIGVERAVWKLVEDPQVWTAIGTGQTVTYPVFTDVPGGGYRVFITSETGGRPEQVLAAVTAEGKENSGREFRAVRAVYSRNKTNIVAPLHAASMSEGSGMVYWGPIMSLANMSLGGGAGAVQSNQLFPRKFIGGGIDHVAGLHRYPHYVGLAKPFPVLPPPTNAYRYGVGDQNSPNGGGCVMPDCEWMVQSTYTVPALPAVDVNYYRNIAKSQGNYTPAAGATLLLNDIHAPCAPGANNLNVYFYEGSVTFTGDTFLCGVLVVMGDVVFSGNGYDPGTPGAQEGAVPAAAWREYQFNVPVHMDDYRSFNGGYGAPGSATGYAGAHYLSGPAGHACPPGGAPHGDSAGADEYPGDDGARRVRPLYRFNVDGGTDGGPQQLLSVNGVVYAQGVFSSSGNTSIYGAVIAGGVKDFGYIYFNEQSDVRVSRLSPGTLRRQSWVEVTPRVF